MVACGGGAQGLSLSQLGAPFMSLISCSAHGGSGGGEGGASEEGAAAVAEREGEVMDEGSQARRRRHPRCRNERLPSRQRCLLHTSSQRQLYRLASLDQQAGPVHSTHPL
eukprot:7244396-Prymnesium_polylepis.1